MTESDHRQYICGAHVVVCTQAYTGWYGQKDCGLKDPDRDRCLFVTSDGICERDKMECEN